MEVNILLVIVGGIIAIGAIVGFAKGAVRIAVSLGATILTLRLCILQRRMSAKQFIRLHRLMRW